MIETILGIGIVGLAFAFLLSRTITKIKIKDKKVDEISHHIHQGALTFLNSEYKIVAVFAVIVAVVLYFTVDYGFEMALSFIVGVVLSAVSGRIGMYIATKANARTAEACETDINSGLKIAFNSGVVMGITVVSLGVMGIAVFYLFPQFKDPNMIFGFAFGASYMALFARVGGGIYTKSADVGADLVGKVEKGIPEDDPRNPAVIADNVGDNVGDVAGMGADLFESYVESIVAAMVIGFITFQAGTVRDNYVLLPLALSALGIVASILGTFFVRVGKNSKNLSNALTKGTVVAAILTVAGSYFLIDYMVGSMGMFYATLSGLLAGVIIGFATDYYTSNMRKPAQEVSSASQTGAGTNVIEGLALGMWSTIIPVL